MALTDDKFSDPSYFGKVFKQEFGWSGSIGADEIHQSLILNILVNVRYL